MTVQRTLSAILISASLIGCQVDPDDIDIPKDTVDAQGWSTDTTKVDGLSVKDTDEEQRRQYRRVHLDSLSKVNTAPRPRATMRVDTIHEDVSPYLKDVVHESFKASQEFLDEHGIRLEVDDEATSTLNYTDAFTNAEEMYHWENGRIPPSTINTTGTDRGVRAATKGRPQINSKLADEVTEAVNASEQVHDYILSQDTLDKGIFAENPATGMSTWYIAKEAKHSLGQHRFDTQRTTINLDAHLSSTSLRDSSSTTKEYLENLEDTLTRSTVHELGHDAGLIHPVEFPNNKVWVDYEKLSLANDDPNVMATKTSIDHGTDPLFTMTDFQASLWKQGLTEGTALYEAQRQHPDSVDTYYQAAFKHAHPASYNAGDTVQVP